MDNVSNFFNIFSVENSSIDPKKKQDHEIGSEYEISDAEDDIYVKQQVQRYKKPGMCFQLRNYFSFFDKYHKHLRLIGI